MLDRLSARIQKRWMAAMLGSLFVAGTSQGQFPGTAGGAPRPGQAVATDQWRSAAYAPAVNNRRSPAPPMVHHAPISESTVFPVAAEPQPHGTQTVVYADDESFPELPDAADQRLTEEDFQSYWNSAPSGPLPTNEFVSDENIGTAEIEPDATNPVAEDYSPTEGDYVPTDGEYSTGEAYEEGDGIWQDGATLLARKAPIAPNMLGDFLGKFYVGAPPPPDENIIRTPEDAAYYKTLIRFKAADNRSPRPQTRLHTSFNYFDGVYGSSLNLGRVTFGGEYAMFNKLFSVELYGDYNDFSNGTVHQSGVWGDLQTVLKGVLYQRQNMLLSWGTGIGYPTADRPPGAPGASVQVSPFIGYMFTSSNGRWFIQGFEQFDVMIREQRQLLHTDIGVGAWLLPWDETRRITGIAPTMELHVYTPIQPSKAKPPELRGLIFEDVVNLTFGATTFITPSLSFAAGVGVPLTDKDYNVEGMFHFNWFYGGLR